MPPSHLTTSGTPAQEPAAPTSPPEAAAGIQQPLRGFVFLAGGQLAGQVIGFAVLALVARTAGPSNIGAYQFAAATLGYFSLVSNLGLTSLAIREAAVKPDARRQIAGEILLLRLSLAIGLSITLVALTPTVAPQPHMVTILHIITVKLLIDAVACDWLLQASGHLRAAAIATLAGQVIYGAITPIILTAGFDSIKQYALMNMVGAAVTSVATLVIMCRSIGTPEIHPALSRLIRRLRASTPFAWSAGIIQLYYILDFVLLGYLKGPRAVGEFGIAYRLPQGLIALVALWVAVLYPYAARRGSRHPSLLRHDIGRAATFTAVASAGLVAGTVPLATPLIASLFGHAFTPAGPTFAVLMAGVAIVAVSVNFGNVLLAIGDERRYAIGITAGVAIDVVADFLLIPRFGAIGAATATLIAETVIFAYMVRRVLMIVGRPAVDWYRLVRGAAAAAIMGVILGFAHSLLPALGMAAVGVIVFAIAGMILRVWSVADLAVWRSPS